MALAFLYPLVSDTGSLKRTRPKNRPPKQDAGAVITARNSPLHSSLLPAGTWVSKEEIRRRLCYPCDNPIDRAALQWEGQGELRYGWYES